MEVNSSNVDYLLVERALSGGLSLDKLNAAEKSFCHEYKNIFDIGRLANRMAQGYYAHVAAVQVARDSRSKELIASIPGHPVPEGYVFRNDGTKHVFDFPHYINYLNEPTVVDDLARTWLVSSLLAVGDALSDHHYFDPDQYRTLHNGQPQPVFIQGLAHAPIFELVYHLRNGISHGNEFTFRVGTGTPGISRLNKYPAHNKQAQIKHADFEINQSLQGHKVLFDFIGPGDILDLLMSVEVSLTRLRERASRNWNP
jgi:hypothetical protein